MEKPKDYRTKETIINQLKEELKKTEREIITEFNTEFPTRLGRYVKIKLIKYTLNRLTL